MQYDKEKTAKTIGVGVLALTFGLPALERAGFCDFLGYVPNSGIEVLFSLATLGGALGGALLTGKNYIAGFLGGLLAGFFFTFYGICFNREAMSAVQFLLLQFVGTIPGYALYRLLKRDDESVHGKATAG